MSIDSDSEKSYNLILDDVFNNISKKNPVTLVFFNQSSDLEKGNLFRVFSRYTSSVDLIKDTNNELKRKILKADIVYFHGGNPYKYTIFNEYKEYIKKVPIKIGNSAGAILLSNHTFYFQKDDYIVAIPNMLNFVNLHVFAHSEIYKDEIVFNYLLYENPTNILRLYGNSCLKIDYSIDDKKQKVFSIIDNGTSEKIELFIKKISYTCTKSQEIDLLDKLINY